MKFTFDNLTRTYSSKGQIGMIDRKVSKDRRGVMLILITLVISLVACNRPQQSSSGSNISSNATSTPGSTGTQTPSGYAGGAVLNLERWAYFFGGDDEQHEVGAIQLKFSESTEENLIVEGTGKTVWTENSRIPNCSYKVKTEGTVTVTGIYDTGECKFDLRINVKLPPSANSYDNSGNCGGTIIFNNPESSERIILNKPYSRSNEITGGWWQTSNVKVTNISSNIVTGCLAFTPEVIPKSTDD
jgi:hypothetical protein